MTDLTGRRKALAQRIPPDIADMLPRAAGLTVAAHSTNPAIRSGALVGDLVADLDNSELRNLAICLASFVDPRTIVAQVLAEPLDPINLSITAAAHRFGISEAAMLNGSRYQEVVDARHVAAYAARLYGMKLVPIGKALNQDHTTILYGCTRVGENARLRRIAGDIATALGWDRNDGEVA